MRILTAEDLEPRLKVQDAGRAYSLAQANVTTAGRMVRDARIALGRVKQGIRPKLPGVLIGGKGLDNASTEDIQRAVLSPGRGTLLAPFEGGVGGARNAWLGSRKKRGG